MRERVVGLVLAIAIASAMSASPAAQQPDADLPPWAYLVNTPRPPGAPRPPQAEDDGTRLRLPDTDVALTRTQLRDLFDVPDWRPGDHPPMPAVVVNGRRPDVRGCGYCHQPNGHGRPENSPVAGLPAAYIVQQIRDFKNGRRTSAEPRMRPPALMVEIAKAATDAEIEAAAAYFSSFEMTPWIRVVETATVPRTVVRGMLVPAPDGGREPIGRRIIEIPEDPDRTALRDPASGFVAYVPVGSVTRGEAIVTDDGCEVCHGAGLMGLGPVPPIAGRSPSYLVRQLFDLQQGARNGLWADLMRDTVDGMSLNDMIAVAAYSASLSPDGGSR